MINIGIIGGGQLAKMIIRENQDRDLAFTVLDPNIHACAFSDADIHLIGDYNDKNLIQKLFNDNDYIIYEFENIDLKVFDHVDKTKLVQGTEILRISQDRLLEKNSATISGLKCPKYEKVVSHDTLRNFILENGKSVIKSRRFGYDGKNQVVINDVEEINKNEIYRYIDENSIIEKFVDYDYEISIIGYKCENELHYYQCFRNKHVNGILETSEIYTNTSIVNKAWKEFTKFSNGVNYQGILCIEFFVKDEEVIFNEIAPRPHNSGHITLISHEQSQFRNLINFVLKEELNNTLVNNQYCMKQILGQDYNWVKNKLINHPELFYDYEKNSDVINRKVGHYYEKVK